MLKRGVSPVVATVLLLVITVVIASIIFSFVVPFVNKQLGNSKACLNVLDGVEFPESRFNCYETVCLGPCETGVSVKVKKSGVVGARIAFIDANENAEVYDVDEGMVSANLRSVGVGQAYSSPLEFPGASGQRTYVTNAPYVRAEISPMTESGDVCAVSDVVEFTPCTSDVVL